MSRRFPPVRSPEEYERVRLDERRMLPGVRAVCERLGRADAHPRRFAGGSLPVYAVGEALVLKLYPPYDIHERDTEATVLRAIGGRLSVPTPEVQQVGALDGWGYLAMTRLRGESLASAWPRISDGDRLRLARDLGRALAELHATSGPHLESVRVDWPAFVARQRATALERQERHGLASVWLEQIPAFLDSVELGLPPADCLLHTEVMREHLLVEREAGDWRLSGLFDLEPAMVGAAEYEFASVGLFFSCGEGRLLRHLLLAYGYRRHELGPELGRRLMAYALLHRYSNLQWWLERRPAGHGATSLDQLAALWWGTGA